MSKNINQIAISAGSVLATDKLYLGRAPFGITDDRYLLGSDLITQFGAPLTTKGDLFTYSTMNARLPVGTVNGQVLQVNSAATTGLAWSTATYPVTTTINRLLFSSANNTVGEISTLNDALLITSNTGVPSFSNSAIPAFTMAGDINMGSHFITNLLDPVNPQDAATKNYVSTIAAGLNPISGVYAASTTDLTGYTYNNGTAGVGATLTAPGTGVFTVDGISPPVGSKFLYKDDATFGGVANGIYTVTTSSGGTNAVLTRWTGYDTPNEIHVGDLLSVELGTVNANSSWYQTNTVTTIGTDPIAFSVWFNPANYVSSTLTSSHILVGSAGNIATDVAMSGDIAIDNVGATTIQNGVVTNAKLATIANLTIKSNISGGVASPSDNSLTAIIDAALGSVQGDILYRNAAVWAALPPGSAGQLLRTGGAAANPSWTTAAFPTIAGPINSILISDSTNYIASTSLWPNSVGTVGKILRSDGTSNTYSTSTFADTYSINTILYNATANTVSGATLTSIMDSVFGNTQGDILYRNATVWTVLSPGTSGNFLQTQGAAANPIWAAVSASGTVNSGTAGQLAYYATSTNAVSGNSNITVSGSQLTAGSIAFSTTTGVVGTTTNNNAAAGSVGEFVSSVILSGSAVTATANAASDVTSISLTAGDWDVWGNITWPTTGTTVNGLIGWISSTSATLPDLALRVAVITNGNNFGLVVPQLRFSLSTTTTIYLSGLVSNSGGNGTQCGGLYARRVR